MTRQWVVSSCIEGVGYAVEARTLEVEFNGGVYQYLDVPPLEHEALMGASSMGQHVNGCIKTRYACRQVRGQP